MPNTEHSNIAERFQRLASPREEPEVLRDMHPTHASRLESKVLRLFRAANPEPDEEGLRSAYLMFIEEVSVALITELHEELPNGQKHPLRLGITQLNPLAKIPNIDFRPSETLESLDTSFPELSTLQIIYLGELLDRGKLISEAAYNQWSSLGNQSGVFKDTLLDAPVW